MQLRYSRNMGGGQPGNEISIYDHPLTLNGTDMRDLTHHEITSTKEPKN